MIATLLSLRGSGPTRGAALVPGAALVRGAAVVRAAGLALLLTCAAASAQQPAPPGVHHDRGTLVLDGVPAADPALAARLARYAQARDATFLDWLPDGGMLIRTRFGAREQIHRVSSPLGMREQLTFFTQGFTAARVPQVTGAAGFAVLLDGANDGDPPQLAYVALAGHGIRALTQDNAAHGDPVWSKDGKRLAFYAVGSDGESHDIYLVDLDSGAAPRLMLAGQHKLWYPLDWSPDGRQLLLLQHVSSDENDLFLADVTSGALTPVDPSAKKADIRAAQFDPSGRGVYQISEGSEEFAGLSYIDLTTHAVREVTANVSWDVEAFDVSADGRYLAYVVNEDGASRLTVLDQLQKLELAPAGLPDGRIANVRFDRSGRRLAITAESADSPRDVYVYQLEKNMLERWTKSERGPVGDEGFVAPKLVHYPTWDRTERGRRLQSAYLYEPRAAGTHPVLLLLHDEPESQFRPTFDPFLQFVVNELGYAVLAPNVRGSGGYGRTFLRLDDGKLRGDALRDIGSLLVWVGMQPQLDAQHVAVMGRSYGGYMALACLAAYNDRLRGAVDVSGPSNLVSYLQHASPEVRDLDRSEYGDERDPPTRDFLESISPSTNVRSIRRPVLVVQGLHDASVPAVDATLLVTRMREHGGTVWYVGAKDEGHEFRSKPTREAVELVAAQFLQELAK